MFIFGKIRDGEKEGSKKVFVYHIHVYNEDMRHMLLAQSYVPGALTSYIAQNHVPPRFVAYVCLQEDGTYHLEVYEDNVLILKDTTPHTKWTSPLITAYSLLEKKSKEEYPDSVFVILNE
jgi:hypothetical protein